MRHAAVFFCCVAILWPACSSAADPSLDAPDEAPIGSYVEVSYSGPRTFYDYVYTVSEGTPDAARVVTKGNVGNAKEGIRLQMPEAPGDYEVRYWSSTDRQILARDRTRVIDVPATLTFSNAANQGSRLEVTWQGPGITYDRIVLNRPQDPDDAKALAQAAITNKTKPLQLTVPDEPGEYELRYVTARTKRVLTRAPITVVGVDAAISAPDTAEPGNRIDIEWQGPGNNYDTIVLVAPGAQRNAKSLAAAAILNGKNPVQMLLPDTSGDFELRYRTTASKAELASRPIQLLSVSATLNAPASAIAGSTVPVNWQGPGNDYDRIAVFAAGATDTADALKNHAILSKRNPVLVALPDTAGDYELRYITQQGKRILGRRPISALPAGKLRVVFERTGTVSSNTTSSEGAVGLILDASGSMLQRVDGVRRIEIARQVLDNLVRNDLPKQVNFALRVFGHKAANECRTDLEIPLAPLNREAAAERINSVNAMNLAKTPIADSLAQVPNDLAGAKGRKSIVLITDGEETCDGDPAAVIEKLRSGGLDVQVSIVGFAIDDVDLKATFERWAEIGGGSYFDANSAEDLARSLRQVISGPFEVMDQDGRVVAEGIAGGAPVTVAAGSYRVRMKSGVAEMHDVAVVAEQVTDLAF